MHEWPQDVAVCSLSVRHPHLQLCRKYEPRILTLTQRARYCVRRTPHSLLQQSAAIVLHDDRFVQIGHIIVQTQRERRIVAALHNDAVALAARHDLHAGTCLRHINLQPVHRRPHGFLLPPHHSFGHDIASVLSHPCYRQRVGTVHPMATM